MSESCTKRQNQTPIVFVHMLTWLKKHSNASFAPSKTLLTVDVIGSLNDLVINWQKETFSVAGFFHSSFGLSLNLTDRLWVSENASFVESFPSETGRGISRIIYQKHRLSVLQQLRQRIHEIRRSVSTMLTENCHYSCSYPVNTWGTQGRLLDLAFIIILGPKNVVSKSTQVSRIT